VGGAVVWSKQGDQGKIWNSANVNLSSVAGHTLALEFVGTRGSSWAGDAAIDNVRIDQATPTPPPTPVPTAAPIRCRFSAEKTNTYLMGCPTQGGCRIASSLEEAKAECDANPTCGGVARTSSGSFFTRGGPQEIARDGESSWSCYDMTLHCTRFPFLRGTEQERCEGGNALQQGYEYVYNAGRGTAAAACGAGSTCKCCKRLVDGGVDPNLPKIMTILMLQLNFTDIHPEYGSNKDIENAVYGKEGGDAAVGETEGSFGHIINSSTYGRVTAPRWAGAVVTLDMGTTWGNVSNCPTEGIAREARQKLLEQTDLDLDAFDFHSFLLPNSHKANCPFVGLADLACGNPSILPLAGANSYCSAWFFTASPFTIAHEFGHNLGLSHAVAPNAEGMMVSYDPEALVSNSYLITDFTAAHRYQMGVLREAPGEIIKWTRGTPAMALQSISLPLGQPGADYVSVRIPCSACVPKQPGRQDNVGGDLFVQFRGDEGYSGLKLARSSQNKVYVHLARQLSRWNNQYGAKNGKGTELWAVLGSGEAWSDATLGLAVRVCEIYGDWAKISVAEDEAAARQSCPTPQSTTTTTPYVIHRCGFTEMPAKRIGGFVWDWVYDTMEEAKFVCDQESSCTGIYQARPGSKFEVRTGSSWGWAHTDAMSWACLGHRSNGAMETMGRIERLDFSVTP